MTLNDDVKSKLVVVVADIMQVMLATALKTDCNLVVLAPREHALKFMDSQKTVHHVLDLRDTHLAHFLAQTFLEAGLNSEELGTFYFPLREGHYRRKFRIRLMVDSLQPHGDMVLRVEPDLNVDLAMGIGIYFAMPLMMGFAGYAFTAIPLWLYVPVMLLLTYRNLIINPHKGALRSYCLRSKLGTVALALMGFLTGGIIPTLLETPAGITLGWATVFVSAHLLQAHYRLYPRLLNRIWPEPSPTSSTR